jgi:hypothetical protein
MELDVWIEYENGQSFEWEGGDWAKDVVDGSVAKTRSPFFPCGHEAFAKVRELIASEKYQNDWDDPLTRYVIVPKFEIINIIESLYSTINHLNKELDELKKYVIKLPDNQLYKLVSQEF